MRKPLNKQSLELALSTMASRSQGEGAIFLTGGACAVYKGWREATLDIDIKIDPEPLKIYEAIQYAKRHCQVNIELASPADFIPELNGWRERSVWIKRYGSIDVFHYDFISQALSKIERHNDQDLQDVFNLMSHQGVSEEELMKSFNQIRSQLIKYPRLEEELFEQKIMRTIELWRKRSST